MTNPSPTPTAKQKVAAGATKAAIGAILVALGSLLTSNPAVLGSYTAVVVLVIREVDNTFFQS